LLNATKLQTALSFQEEVKVERNKRYIFSKRIIDFIGSFIGLILLSPVFFMISFLIKIENPRSKVFFRQERVGKDGEIFYMYKFRSMVEDAELMLDDLLEHNETTGAMFKMKNDPRITKIGHFLRKTSLDELPQLWNVLNGDMSLVGPRPPLPREVKDYTAYDLQRLLVVPGCTGLWQVSGRSNLGFEEMVQLDLQYISERNIFLDIKLIIKTFFIILTGKGAY
jgi:lipopolysaccharide/colanic/teichoic acid biosynthesis glycosyltransferase